MRGCCWFKVTSSLATIMVNLSGKGKFSQTLPQGQLEHILPEFCLKCHIAWTTFLPDCAPPTLRRVPAIPQAHLPPHFLLLHYILFLVFSSSVSLLLLSCILQSLTFSFMLTCPPASFAYLISLRFCPLYPPHTSLHSCCTSARFPHGSTCPFSIYLFFSMHLPSVFLLDRGAPASETPAWDLPLPQLPHPLHRHSVPSWYWLSGLWSRLCPQSHHPAPSLLHPLRLYLAEKERVLHWGPAAGSLRYSRTAVCHQVEEPDNSAVWAPLM